TYLLENHGQADLIIDRIKGDCGCMAVELSAEDKIVRPGETREVVAIFNSAGRPGKQKKSVRVYSNDPRRSRVMLNLVVEVVTLARITPSQQLNFRGARRGQAIAQKLSVLPSKPDGHLEIISFNIGGGALAYTTEPIVRNDALGYTLHFFVDPNARLGDVMALGELIVTVDDEPETKKIRVNGQIVGDLTVRPPLVRVGLDKPLPRGMKLRPVTVSSEVDQPFAVLDASAGDNFDVRVEPGSTPNSYTIRLTIAEAAPDGPCASMLTVRTDNPVQPLVRVPVYTNVAPRLGADPPLVLLRSGDPATASVTVSLQTPGLNEFTILGVTSNQSFIDADQVESDRPRPGVHLIRVSAGDQADSGEHEAVITVRTDVVGAEEIQLPVILSVP
ncbi:MAG: DUF1573 domain-containing protein, partial [bacterium]|nr:DUF1573 domain-containing protein [bacterium]